MRTGTNHFKDLRSAIRYFSVYGYDQNEVLEKWRNLEICIGQPLIESNQDFILDKDGRYWVVG